MVPDTLYDLAFTFRKTKLWLKLNDAQLFAVRHSDGTTGYCCVMGMLGEHIAMAVYPDDAGLYAYQRMLDPSIMQDSFEYNECMVSQNCVMVSFQNKSELSKRELEEVNAYIRSHSVNPRGKKAFPQFERHRPRRCISLLSDETDQLHLKEALEAAIYVSEQLTLRVPEALGFTEGLPFNRQIPLIERKDGACVLSAMDLGKRRTAHYSSPRITDELSLAKLKKCKATDKIWVCDIFVHMTPVYDENPEQHDAGKPDEAPYFPYLLVFADNDSHFIFNFQFLKELDASNALFNQLIDIVQQYGKPAQIWVANARAKTFFQNIAPQLGAKLILKKHLPVLEEIKEQMLVEFSDQDETNEQTEALMLDYLMDPSVYDSMPEDILMILKRETKNCGLPQEIVTLVDRECRKRGL